MVGISFHYRYTKLGILWKPSARETWRTYFQYYSGYIEGSRDQKPACRRFVTTGHL